jgi:mRNA interferase MazF
MAKPIAGDVVVLPFPQSDLQPGKRRPALVLADAGGSDLILCQITSQHRSDRSAISLVPSDFEKGHLAVDSYARINRLFTVDQSVVIYVAGKIAKAKLEECKAELRELFT